jgi:hypothetical protein
MHQELIINRLKLLDGNLERINPNLPLEDQVNLLPYDNKYEFPSSNLVLTLNEIKENHLLILTRYLFKKGNNWALDSLVVSFKLKPWEWARETAKSP